ncbi:hypothetical protein SUGI_0652750 [Cryptomeria japonica]|nr:hypothetical protein SUGI_0652750 [Cryptomeria japonica]
MKLDISMAVSSLERQPLHLQGIEERAPEIAFASSQQANNIQKNHLFELPTLQQPMQVEEMRTDPILKTKTEVLLSHYIPVFVMLPLDVISNDNTLQNKDLLKANLKALKSANVDGLIVDVWWGIVEAEGPKQYDWSAYRDLFKLVQEQGFKLQAIMSFHQCGGDNITIPLPKWVLKTSESNPNIFFTNKDGQRNRECLNYGVDDKPVLLGRTAVEIYSDYMKSFKENMSDFLDSRLISEIEVGLGPAGELRFPSFSRSQGWRFPGIGEFQCYDEYLLSDLKAAAESIGRPEWAFSAPDNAGNYNDQPNSTGFFHDHGSYTTDSGKFFLTWYSNVLLRHGDEILEAASKIFEGCPIKLAAKVAGIHWWYKSSNHAAELTAGYYNLDERDGYRPIARMLARHRAVLNFTCIEMQDEEQPSEAGCGPEALAKQVLNAGWKEGIEVSCENALPRYDREGYEQMIRQARPDGINREGRPVRRISALTYLRLSNELMRENPWKEFKRFARIMHVGLDYHPEPEKYFNPRGPLQRSKPRQEIREFLDAAVPLEPFSGGDYGAGDLDALCPDEEESEKNEASFINRIFRRFF